MMIDFMGWSQPYRPVCPRVVHQRVARTLAGSSVNDFPPCQQSQQGRNGSEDASQGKQSVRERMSHLEGENASPMNEVRVADW